MGPLATRYLELHAEFDALARSLSTEEWGTAVPATPGWSARDLLAHVAGIPDDARHGRMAGAPGEEWTAAQVARGHNWSVVELLDRWGEQAPQFAGVLDSIGESRPVFDLLTHEHDLRGAVRRPGRRSGGVISDVTRLVIANLAGGDRLTVETESGRLIEATAGPAVLLRTTDFEVFRSRFGRRSAAQVRAYAWEGDPEPVIAGWFIFGPAQEDVIE